MINLFHRHKFDPDKWKQISKVQVLRQPLSYGGVPISDPMPIGNEIVYSNTCVACGDLEFRRVREIKDE